MTIITIILTVAAFLIYQFHQIIGRKWSSDKILFWKGLNFQIVTLAPGPVRPFPLSSSFPPFLRGLQRSCKSETCLFFSGADEQSLLAWLCWRTPPARSTSCLHDARLVSVPFSPLSWNAVAPWDREPSPGLLLPTLHFGFCHFPALVLEVVTNHRCYKLQIGIGCWIQKSHDNYTAVLNCG